MRIIEYRAVNEIRTVDDEKQMIIEGVVNNIGQWSKPIGGQFREKINEGVFERAINRALESGDIFFYINMITEHYHLHQLNQIH